MTNHNFKSNDPRIGKTLWDDLHKANLKTLKQDFRDIYDFYLDKKARDKLKKKGKVRRFFIVSWWILKSLFFKLTPMRRILLVISIFLSFQTTQFNLEEAQVNINFNFLGFLLLLIILLLELKDKLLARNELAVGRAVQTALMPNKSPKVSGWDIWLYTCPANEIGGDIIDYIRFDSTTWAFALGDVAGKGLGAALIAAKLQATLRAIAPLFKSLEKLAKQTNRILYRDGIPQRFVSLLYLNLRPDSGNIEFINAGHLPPVHIQNSKIEETSMGGQALGLTNNAVYKEESIKLNPGDCFFIYSDGITETMNEKEELFGIERLFQTLKDNAHLSSKEMGKSILSTIERFKGEKRYRDDISLILLKREKEK